MNPFSMLVAGSSQTGKTEWVSRVLKTSASLYSKSPGPVYYFYNQWQDVFDTLEEEIKADFRRGMPSMSFFKDIAGKNATVVIDDMIHHVTEETSELFTVGCSRHLVNIIFITQNLFDKNKFFRTISLNCKYFCIRKNPRDSSSINHFSRQVFPSNGSFLTKVYRDVTSLKPFSYIFFDASQTTPENLRTRSDIFGEDGDPPKCFIPLRKNVLV